MRKLAAYLRRQPRPDGPHRPRSGCGRSCARHGITFQRTRTWKESTDPDRDAKLDRIEDVTSRFPDRCLRLRPVRAAVDPAPPRLRLGAAGPARPAAGDLPPHPRRPLLPRLLLARRRPAVGRHPPPQGRRPHPGRAQVDPRRPPGRRTDLRDPGQPVRPQDARRSARWAKKNKVELCFTPTYASWANPIEAQFGPLRQFTIANSNHPNHTVLTRRPARLPALAQRQRPPPRRPGRPTPRTRPHPQRTATTLGPTPQPSRLIKPGERIVVSALARMSSLPPSFPHRARLRRGARRRRRGTRGAGRRAA